MYRDGEYKTRGEYQKYFDPNWSYYPIYIRKMRYVRNFINKRTTKSDKILDIGYGEGLIINEYRNKGYDIYGMDLNYASVIVQRGDVHHLPFNNESFNFILCLDLIEHLELRDQANALREIYHVLNRSGEAIITILNQSHFYS